MRGPVARSGELRNPGRTGSELVAPKHTMLELDSNFTGSTDHLIAKMILGYRFNF